jgi:uncharacterized protein YrrD
MDSIQKIGQVIGRSVVSLQTANKLGEIHDLLLDPQSGRLAGFSIKRPDDSYALVANEEIHGIGPDAVMINRDESLLAADQSPLKGLPLIKHELVGVKVITDSGHLMGTVADIFIHLSETPTFIYEVRSSIFDKLLGHAFYFPASVGCVLSHDRTALVVSGNPETMDRKLNTVTRRLIGNFEVGTYQPGRVQISVRSHVDSEL